MLRQPPPLKPKKRPASRAKSTGSLTSRLPAYAVVATLAGLLIYVFFVRHAQSVPSRGAARRTLQVVNKDAQGLTADTAAQTGHALTRVQQQKPIAEGLYTLSVQQPDGSEKSLAEYAGIVTLVVNVASQCGYTDSNYRGLEDLRQTFHARGFEVLAFPCNAFGGQEPGSWQEIQAFAKARNISFPVFPKVEVNGDEESPVFAFLKSRLPGASGLLKGVDVAWNFEKWLCNRAGQPVKRYSSAFEGDTLRADIEAQLAL